MWRFLSCMHGLSSKLTDIHNQSTYVATMQCSAHCWYKAKYTRLGLIVWQLYATHTVYMWPSHLSYLLQLGYKTITDNHALLLEQGHNCHHTIITHDLYQDALLHSVIPRPIPSISVCNIESWEWACMRTRLLLHASQLKLPSWSACCMHYYIIVPACHQA